MLPVDRGYGFLELDALRVMIIYVYIHITIYVYMFIYNTYIKEIKLFKKGKENLADKMNQCS